MKRRALLLTGGVSLGSGCMRLEQTAGGNETRQPPQDQNVGDSNDSNQSEESESDHEPPTVTGTWSQFGNDAANTGYTSAAGVTEKNVIWTQRINVGGEVGGPIVADGKVIVNETAALDPGTGERLWESTFTGSRPTPAYADGLVFTGNDSNVAAIDVKNGEVVWEEPFGAYAITVYDDRLFLRETMKVAAYDFSGQLQWQSQTPSQFRGRHEPACGDGVVCVPVYHTDTNTGGGQIIAFDMESGTQEWEYSIGAASKFAPLIAESKVFFGGRSGVVRALDVSDGSLLWEDDPDQHWIQTSPAYTDGVVYVGGMEGALLGYDPETGDQVFETTNSQIQEYKGGIAVTDEVIYAVGDGGILTANDRRSGDLLWTHEMAEVRPHEQWPAPVDGYVFISDGMGSVYAIEETS